MTDRIRRKRHPGRQLVTPKPEPELLPAAPPRSSGEIDRQVATRLAEAHPIYGAFGHVFREMGGVDRLQEWAEEEPGKFYAIFAKMVPREQGANQINIQINAKLAPGPLDE
jgi:hypothetical protein